MLLVGDKIQQTKAIMGFDYVGRQFTVDAVEGLNIAFSNPRMGRGVMTMGEFEEYFTKVVEPTWSDWTKFDTIYEYRVKDTLIEAREINGVGGSVFCKPCEEDVFILDVGLAICEDKLNIKRLERLAKEIRKIADDKIQELEEYQAQIRREIRDRY